MANNDVVMKNVASDRVEKYRVTKVLNPDKGYPCVFRQYLAESHCRFLHGYDLRFTIVLECAEYDRTPEGWVFDFGEFKWLKNRLDETFDHTALVAESDPNILHMQDIEELALFKKVVVMQDVGAEAFAKFVWREMSSYVRHKHESRKSLRVVSVECHENGSNSATYVAPTN